MIGEDEDVQNVDSDWPADDGRPMTPFAYCKSPQIFVVSFFCCASEGFSRGGDYVAILLVLITWRTTSNYSILFCGFTQIWFSNLSSHHSFNQSLTCVPLTIIPNTLKTARMRAYWYDNLPVSQGPPLSSSRFIIIITAPPCLQRWKQHCTTQEVQD